MIAVPFAQLVSNLTEVNTVCCNSNTTVMGTPLVTVWGQCSLPCLRHVVDHIQVNTITSQANVNLSVTSLMCHVPCA